MSGATDESTWTFGFDMDAFSGGYDIDAAIAAAAPPQVDAGVGEAGSTRSDSDKFEDLTKEKERARQGTWYSQHALVGRSDRQIRQAVTAQTAFRRLYPEQWQCVLKCNE